MNWLSRLLCRVGFHSYKYVRGDSEHLYPVCRRCGNWEHWDGHEYTERAWPPPYPWFQSAYEEWLTKNINERVR